MEVAPRYKLLLHCLHCFMMGTDDWMESYPLDCPTIALQSGS